MKLTIEVTQEQKDKILKDLQVNKGRWIPGKDEGYFYIDSCLPMTQEDSNNESTIDENRIAIGNCYQTLNQAQAVYDLKKHIYSFPMPEDEYYYLNNNGEAWGTGNFEKFTTEIADYHSGIIIATCSTEEDREERFRLLKLAY